MFGTRKLIIKGLTAGGRLGPPSIPLGYASLHYERAQPMTLANDLKVFNFRWQSGVQFWVAVHNQKANGEVREAFGTLNPSLCGKHINGRGISPENWGCTPYWDMEKGGFRSFRWENLVAVI